jgi:hypothetical protein
VGPSAGRDAVNGMPLVSVGNRAPNPRSPSDYLRPFQLASHYIIGTVARGSGDLSMTSFVPQRLMLAA